MDAAAELGRNPVSKHHIQPGYGDGQADAGRDGQTRQILRRERGQGNVHFPCSADHVQDWQPYPVDPYSYYMCVTIHSISSIQYSVFSIQYSVLKLLLRWSESQTHSCMQTI